MPDLLGSYLAIYQGEVVTPLTDGPRTYLECVEILKARIQKEAAKIGRTAIIGAYIVRVESIPSMVTEVSFERYCED